MPETSLSGNKIAVLTPGLGKASETFIRRHVNDLAPGRTVAVSRNPVQPFWRPNCPSLCLHELSGIAPDVFLERLGRKLGFRSTPGHYRAQRFLKTHGVKTVLSQYLNFSVEWFPVIAGLGIDFFAHAHGVDVSLCLRDELWRKRYLIYNEATGVIVVSQHVKARLGELGLNEDRIHVIPCGVDVPREPTIRNIHRTPVRCLAVGRLVRKKAPQLMLGAFHRALKANKDMVLDVVGSGELLPQAEEFVKSHRIEDKVRLHGAQTHDFVIGLMKEADIFIQHSITVQETGDEEGLPVAILEAMALGLPVVSTYHAGIPEAVVNGSNGFLVEEGDVEGMADRIIALSKDLALRAEMGTSGWNRAKERFSWKREREDLIRLFDSNAKQ